MFYLPLLDAFHCHCYSCSYFFSLPLYRSSQREASLRETLSCKYLKVVCYLEPFAHQFSILFNLSHSRSFLWILFFTLSNSLSFHRRKWPRVKDWQIDSRQQEAKSINLSIITFNWYSALLFAVKDLPTLTDRSQRVHLVSTNIKRREKLHMHPFDYVSVCSRWIQWLSERMTDESDVYSRRALGNEGSHSMESVTGDRWGACE